MLVKLCAIVTVLQINLFCGSVVSGQTNDKRVCIIGAGIAGLTTSRHMKKEGINFTVLEATKYIGGTWRYEPRVGNDENGLPIHTSMYEHLRTNLPKKTMELSGFPVPNWWPSFPNHNLYYEYIKDYAKHHDLEKHIQFSHEVTSVRKEGKVWKVKHKHVPSGELFEDTFDYVIVGNGHHSKPNWPSIKGEQLFKGSIIHSHDYRSPDVYRNRRVLLVGAGPSGMDINIDILEVAHTLVHSHHSIVNFSTPWPSNYHRKPDVREFNETGAIFVDGTYEDIDDVVYCTGYKYYYPFLDETSSLMMDGRSVIPLYKYMVNINEPTMMLLGLIVRACLVIAIDAQAQYATALVKGDFSLPSQEKMLEEWQKRADSIRSRGRPMSDIHLLAQFEDEYYAALAEEAGIRRVPPVIYKIRAQDTQAKLQNLYTYRQYAYDIIDDNTFVRRIDNVTNSSKENDVFGP